MIRRRQFADRSIRLEGRAARGDLVADIRLGTAEPEDRWRALLEDAIAHRDATRPAYPPGVLPFRRRLNVDVARPPHRRPAMPEEAR